VRKPHGGRLRVALAFRTRTTWACPNLGLQTVYRLFNDVADVVCERVFLPPKQQNRPGTCARDSAGDAGIAGPIGGFDVFAFSVSFEWDYVNASHDAAPRGPARVSADRTARHPLVVLGGAVTFVNPEPLARLPTSWPPGDGEQLVRRWCAPCVRRRTGPRSTRRCPRARGSTCPRATSRATAPTGAWPRSSRGGEPRPPVVRKAAVRASDLATRLPPRSSRRHGIRSRLLVEVVRGAPTSAVLLGITGALDERELRDMGGVERGNMGG